METLKYAQDLISTPKASTKAGFNLFIMGHAEPMRTDYSNSEDWYSRLQGYEYAKEMAKNNGIAFTHPFKCERSNCHPFQYGGFWVCNSCGQKGVEKDWWMIKVEKDGDEFCCHGLDFINLQESENYAFGKTFESAIANYGQLFSKN